MLSSVLLLAILAFTSRTVTAQTDVASIKTIPVLGAHASVKLSPDGKTIALYETYFETDIKPDSQFLPIRLIDLASGKELTKLTGAADYASDVAFSPDGHQLASYHPNGYIYLWDTATGRQSNQFPALVGISQIGYLAEGKTLAATVNTSFEITLWDTNSGNIINILERRYATYSEYSQTRTHGIEPFRFFGFAVSPHGDTVATLTAAGEISLWGAKDGKETIIRLAPKNPLLDMEFSLKFSPDSRLLGYYDLTDYKIHILDVATGNEVRAIASKNSYFAFSPDDKTIAWAEEQDKNILLHLATESNPDRTIEIAFPDSTKVKPSLLSTIYTPDGSQLILSGFRLLDGQTNQIAVITLK